MQRTKTRALAVPLALLALASAFSVGRPHPAEAAGRRPPNILVIVADDQRADSLQTMPRTRRAFGTRGTSFSDAYVATPLCCPSRATIMSGRYMHNHGVTNNDARSINRLRHRSTVQAYLKRAGYFTGIAGKIFNRWNLDRNPPYFHRWAIMTAGHRAYFNVNGTIRSPDVYSTDYTATKAEDFLRYFDRKRDKRPWLLYVTPFAPHTPFHAAPEYAESSFPSWEGNPAVFDDRSDKPTYVETWNQSYEQASWERQQQYRMLRSVDDLVADLLDTMNELNERNTLAVYTSDNGVFWGEHQLRQKHLPYTGAVKVPLMMRWPGRIAAGGVDRRLASLVDLAPTILDAADITPYREPMDGRSLLGRSQRKQLLIEYERDTPQNVSGAIPRWRSIRDRQKQYSVYLADDGRLLAEEYYDLVNDPWQLTNLLGDGDPTNDPGPYQHERLLRRIQSYSSCVGTSGSRACP